MVVFWEEMFPRWSINSIRERTNGEERERLTFQGNSISSDCSNRSFEHFITGHMTGQRNIFKIHGSSNTSNSFIQCEGQWECGEQTVSLLWHVPSIQVPLHPHESVSLYIFLHRRFSIVSSTRKGESRVWLREISFPITNIATDRSTMGKKRRQNPRRVGLQNWLHLSGVSLGDQLLRRETKEEKINNN